MRNRMRNSRSYGSMWMSLAPFWMLEVSTMFTMRMTGASPVCFSSAATSISSRSSRTSTASPAASACCWATSSALLASSRVLGPVVDPGLRRVVLLQRVGDGLLRGHDRLDVVARHELDVVHGEHVGRVGHRQRQRGAGPAQGHDLVLLRRFRRDQLDHRGIDLEPAEIDGRHPVLAAQQRGDFLIAHEAQLHEVHRQLAAVGLLVAQSLLQLRRRDLLLLQEELTDSDRHVPLTRCCALNARRWDAAGTPEPGCPGRRVQSPLRSIGRRVAET